MTGTPKKPRKLPKGGFGELAPGIDPATINDPDLCEGSLPDFYEAGIDFYCNGTASRSGMQHDRITLGRFRHSTCERASDREPWALPIDGDAYPIDTRGRTRLDCPTCTVDYVLSADRLEALLAEMWSRHSRRVERRNVATLLK